MPLKGYKQTGEHKTKRALIRKENNSYKANSGSFKKGHEVIDGNKTRFQKGHPTWNKGKLINLDLESIKEKYFSELKSTYDISRELKVSPKTIEGRLKDNGCVLRPIHTKHTKIARQKIKQARSKQIFPLKDSSIEIKIQNYLKQLNIEFLTHQYINIKHGYQCDILIPSKNCIIECFGNYWHKYPISRPIDVLRCNELRDNRYKVLVFWEKEIKPMKLIEFENKLKECDVI